MHPGRFVTVCCPSPPAFHAAKCEKLQREKAELERRCEAEVRNLGWQQEAELRDLERRLQLQFETEVARLQEEHRAQLLRIGCQHQEQVSPPGPPCPGEPQAGGGGELAALARSPATGELPGPHPPASVLSPVPSPSSPPATLASSLVLPGTLPPLGFSAGLCPLPGKLPWWLSR